jgi:hypothetical protein
MSHATPIPNVSIRVSLFSRLRYWLIEKIAMGDVVVMNCELGAEWNTRDCVIHIPCGMHGSLMHNVTLNYNPSHMIRLVPKRRTEKETGA